MKNWLPYELHTHTYHSDGNHSLLEMAEAAKEMGLHGFASTDHNTMTALLDKEQVELKTSMRIIRGLEWTTFFGHMVALGVDRYVEWRDLGIDDIHTGIARIHEAGGLAGIAHPYRVGSPLCTGCYWEYPITDWHDVDYLEVWSYTFPSIMKSNQRAFQLWDDLLNQGYRITGVCGRDWHVIPDNEPNPIAVSYIYCDKQENSSVQERQVIEAISKGKVTVSVGPLLTFEIVYNNQKYEIGDEIDVSQPDENFEILFTLDTLTRAGIWDVKEQEFTVKLKSNAGLLNELKVSPGNPNLSHTIQFDDLRWLRAELHGELMGIHTMIAFTNPVYFTNGRYIEIQGK
ncbi:CehA/McbA family metallohydrolase [Paenibacillus chungangensis]|uniref:CehA/McbA family metallohydrolase n=1 Tax=Paenibacillus chungangensis TaxID=696535 RepID=A0ABW3HLG9_9BACL